MANLTVPVVSPVTLAIKSAKLSASRTSTSARGTRALPDSLRLAPRPVRKKSFAPSSASSCDIALLTEDCVDSASMAVREKLPVAATLRKILRLWMSMAQIDTCF
jgi:hypothetical protein